MNKIPEELAEEFAELFAGERRKTIAKKSWWTGYQAAQQWISVKERLPENGIPVLAFVFDTIEVGYIETLTTDDYEFHWIGDHNYIDKGHRAITHWMPLPAAPKEEA